MNFTDLLGPTDGAVWKLNTFEKSPACRHYTTALKASSIVQRDAALLAAEIIWTMSPQISSPQRPQPSVAKPLWSSWACYDPTQVIVLRIMQQELQQELLLMV